MQRVGLAGVPVEARSAERRPQLRRVDGDDGPQAGRPVVEEHDLFEFVPELCEDPHQRLAGLRPACMRDVTEVSLLIAGEFRL